MSQLSRYFDQNKSRYLLNEEVCCFELAMVCVVFVIVGGEAIEFASIRSRIMIGVFVLFLLSACVALLSKCGSLRFDLSLGVCVVDNGVVL